jgi:arylsulfatase A-like enzyme
MILSCGSPGERRAESARGRRPNILFIYTDDHSTAAVGAYGSLINATPNIDRLAAEGMLFGSAFCTNGICAPARAVVLTGLHSHKNGVPDNGARFDGSQTTFPQLLQAAGYDTALIGKWHLKSDPTGFDHWEVLPGQGHYYAPDFDSAAGRRRIEGYATEITTDLALEWLDGREDQDRPFLLMCQHKAPHRSWMPGPAQHELLVDEQIPEPVTLFDDHSGQGTAAREQEMSIAHHMYDVHDLKLIPNEQEAAELEGPDKWADTLLDRMTSEQRTAWDAAYVPIDETYDRDPPTGDELVSWKYQRYIKDYLRCISSVDDNVGRMLDWLEENDLADNTIVVYSSDQGFFLGEHGWYDKRFMYEPALRLPLIVRWPGVTEPGTRDDHLVQNLDLAQTFLDAAGVAAPQSMQGASLLPLLAGADPDDWRESIYYEYFEKGVHNVQPHHGVRTARHKLMRFPGLDEWELYDLELDPHEMTSVHDDPAYAAVRAELEQELQRLRELYEVPEA